MDYFPVCETSRLIGVEGDNNHKFMILPKFDIQKAIDYPRSDFDSDSVEAPQEDNTVQKLNQYE